MSVRNIRNHQSRGLLPPPEVRARIGYYGPQHVARLRLIQEMQGEGFKLSAISRLIGEHGADADRFVGLRQAVTAPFATEAPEVYSREELVEKRSEEHTSELQSHVNLVCRLLLEKKKKKTYHLQKDNTQ